MRNADKERTQRWNSVRLHDRLERDERAQYDKDLNERRLRSLQQMLAARTAQAGTGPVYARRPDTRYCDVCESALTGARRSTRRYCSEVCKVEARRGRSAPEMSM
jgi:hypothetical protein